MSFAMTTSGNAAVTRRGPAEFVMPQSGTAPAIQIADKTYTTTKTSSSTATLNVGCSNIRVVIYSKTLVVGANTGANSGPIFYVEGADDSGFTTNLTVIGGYVQAVNIASTTEVQCFVITGIVPVATKAFLRVTVDPTLMGAGSSGTFDALVEATP